MFKNYAILFILATSTNWSSQALSLSISEIELDNNKCDKHGELFMCITADGQEISISPQSNFDFHDENIEISFNYVISDQRFSETLAAPVEVLEPDFSITNTPYNPEQQIKDYINNIKQKSYITRKHIIWNQEKLIKLNNSWPVVVHIIQDNCPVIFDHWAVDENKKQHCSELYLTYHLDNDYKEFKKMLDFECIHDAKSEKNPNLYFCSNSDICSVNKITYESSGKYKNWRKQNGIEPIEPYSAHVQSAPLNWRILNKINNVLDQKYWSIKNNHHIRCPYVYVDGQKNYFLCYATSCEFSEQESGNAGCEIQLLRPTNEKIPLSKNATLEPSSGFNINGFYQLKSEEDSENALTQVWQDLFTGDEVVYKSTAHKPAFIHIHILWDFSKENILKPDEVPSLELFYKALSEHPGLTTYKFKEVTLNNKFLNSKQFALIAHKLRGVEFVNLADFNGHSDCVARFLENNKQSIRSLDLSQSGQGPNGLVGNLICHIRDLSNLEELNVRNDCVLGLSISNIKTIELCRALVDLKKLKKVNITLPYAISAALDAWDLLLRGDQDAPVFLTFIATCLLPIIEAMGTIGGHPADSVVYSLNNLAKIPALESLTISLLGLNNDKEKVKSLFNIAREKEKLRPLNITIAN